MTTTLITGATRGLGRETARRLVAEGHDVWIGARDADRGRAVAAEIEARSVQLDVTDDASVAAAVETVGALDVLVNNAGILGAIRDVGETTPEDLAEVYATNVLGVVRVTQAFLPLLLDSDAGVIVNVSSGMGSFAVTSDPERLESTLVGLAYPSSKSALTMLTTQYAKAFAQLRINAVDPGYTATDFNGHSGHKTVEQGAEAIVRAALIGPDGPSGTFTDDQGTVPW